MSVELSELKMKNDKQDPPTSSKAKKRSLMPEFFKKKIAIKVKKPLIPLKIALFIWFGAGSSIFPFIQVFLKQRGLTIAQISFIYMLNPCLQFLGPIISGAIADKIGRSKPVVLGNMFLAVTTLSSMLLIPNINIMDCERNTIRMACFPELVVIEGSETCNTTTQRECEAECPFDQTYRECHSNNTFCHETLNNATKLVFENVTLSTFITNANMTNFSCHAEAMFLHTKNFNWCENPYTQNCNFSCHFYNSNSGKDETSCNTSLYDNSELVFFTSLVLLISFHTVVSTVYRMLDFTVMSMVKAHDSDFGRERLWAVTGSFLFSILSGLAVDMTTKEGNPKNYNTAIYLFDVMIVITMLTIYKLDIQIQPRGKQMIKKSISLLKDVHVLVFSVTILMLGTCWCFTRQFSPLYLDYLGGSSLLLGLAPALNCLFGIPFTVTSNFWVDKIGSNNVLILGFASHTIYYIGYAYLINPWWSLTFEITGIFSYHILWVAVIRHSYTIAPQGLTATVISTAGALHFAIGKGTGSMLGGLTMSKYGGCTAFQLMAVTSGSAGALYALYLVIMYFLSKKRQKISLDTEGRMETASPDKTEIPACMTVR